MLILQQELLHKKCNVLSIMINDPPPETAD